MFGKKAASALIPNVKSMGGMSWKKIWPFSSLDWKSLFVKGLIFCCTFTLLFALIFTIKPFLMRKFVEPKDENGMRVIPDVKNSNFIATSNDTAELLPEETGTKLSDGLPAPIKNTPEGISTPDDKGDAKKDSATINPTKVDLPEATVTKADDTLHPASSLPVPIENDSKKDSVPTSTKIEINSSTKVELPKASDTEMHDNLASVIDFPKSKGIKTATKDSTATVIDVKTNFSAEAPGTKTHGTLHSDIALPAPAESTPKRSSIPTRKDGDLNVKPAPAEMEPISLPDIKSPLSDIIPVGNQTSIIDSTKENLPKVNLKSHGHKVHKIENPNQSDALPGLARGPVKSKPQAEEIQEFRADELDEFKANTKEDTVADDANLKHSKRKHKSDKGKKKAPKAETDVTAQGPSAEDDMSIFFSNFPMFEATSSGKSNYEDISDEFPKRNASHPDNNYGMGTSDMNLLKTNEKCFCGLNREECSCPSDSDFCESCTYDDDNKKTFLEQFLSDISGFFERFPWQDDFRNFGDLIKQNTERFFHRVTPW